MLLEPFQHLRERLPADRRSVEEGIALLKERRRSLKLLDEALDRLRVSWRDEDPGKYGPHWHALKEGRKAWPAELIESSGPSPKPGLLHPLEDLDRRPCPSCKASSLDVCRYSQAEDGPDGDLWEKTFFVLCPACASLQYLRVERSAHRF